MALLASLALAAAAIVSQDQVALRAAPRDSAQQQALLSQGDLLEVRGQRMDYLQVYDHRRERAGYVRAALVHPVTLQAAEAPELMSVFRFLRDTPGAEALGIAYAAAYLKAAPAEAIGAEVFDALGSMAERLARNASARRSGVNDAALVAHLETAASYGVMLNSFEREERLQLCYDGEAYRRVLALPATPEQAARAALGLTRHECVDPKLSPAEHYALDQWRAQVLDRVDLRELVPALKNRVRMRRAGVWAALAFEQSRRNEAADQAAERALDELGGVVKSELADDDQRSYTEAAVRVSASRWAAMPEPVPHPAGKLPALVTVAGQPGETCVLLVDATHDVKAPLVRRCTYGTVWTASAQVNARSSSMTLAVQPLDTWLELWVLRKSGHGWVADVLPPAADGPDIGYAEFAGWTPDGSHLLAVREAREAGRWQKHYEVVRLDTLVTEKRADKAESLRAFRWQSPAWKRQTLSLR